MNPLLTILIPTLPERASLLKEFHHHYETWLARKLWTVRLQIRILTNNDVLSSVGTKRQQLLLEAHSLGSEYIVFIDDDDWVSLDYFNDIPQILTEKKPDCIGFYGLVLDYLDVPPLCPTSLFVHSLKYQTWENHPSIHCRPPNHINPVRTELALKAGFTDLKIGEDKDYSMRLLPHLNSEVFIPKVLYYYRKNFTLSGLPQVGGKG